jgi:hypothetical protein
MSLRFVVFKGGAGPDHNRACFAIHWAKSATTWASLHFTQLARLLKGGHLERAGQQGLHRRHRDIFHLFQTHVQAWAFLAPMLSHDDFSPAFGQILDVLEILRRKLARSHVASVQRDKTISPGEILP